MRDMRKVLFSTSLYLIGGIIGILLLESYYQVVEIELPYHELNERVGKKMIPSRRINYFKEGFYLGASNEYGYLGNPYPPVRNNDKIRIALLGDSYVEGLHVFEDHHFSKILEKMLNEDKLIPEYEILNFGMGNYHYNDMVILYKNFVEEFNPDILILIVSVRDFMFRDDLFVPSPVLMMDNDSLVIDYSFTSGRTYQLYKRLSFFFENSCMIKALNNAYKMTKRAEFMQILFDKFYRSGQNENELQNPTHERIDLDIRVIKSIDWFRDRKVFFVFKEGGSPELMHELDDSGVITFSIESVLISEFIDKGIHHEYWDVTNTGGHWNHAAQKVVGEYLYRLIKQYEE
ncbi:MAG: hypothetical protein AMS23_03310 [Bacteroides sp. SM1_62]|nr:MAG: hypothetical protein AMS23_03310 [Bacteroides sp. SM1_62]